jgi:hypothetical protein
MSRVENSWTMEQFRENFEDAFWAATQAPQMVTVRGRPSYVLVPESAATAKALKATVAVTLHKLQNPKRKSNGSSKGK